MTVALQTRYIGPTNYRGSRVAVETMDTRSDGKKIRRYFEWNPAHNSEQNHRNAALAVAKELNWGGKWVAGGSVDGYVFVKTFPDEFAFEFEADPTR